MFLATTEEEIRPLCYCLNIVGVKSVITNEPLFDMANKYQPKHIYSKNGELDKLSNPFPHIRLWKSFEVRDSFFPAQSKEFDLIPATIACIDSTKTPDEELVRILDKVKEFTTDYKVYGTSKIVQGVSMRLSGGMPEYIYRNADIGLALNAEQALKIMWCGIPCVMENPINFAYEIEDIPTLIQDPPDLSDQIEFCESMTYFDEAINILMQMEEHDLQNKILHIKERYLNDIRTTVSDIA